MSFFIAMFVSPRLMEARLKSQLVSSDGVALSFEGELNRAVQDACGTLTRGAVLVPDPAAAIGWRTEPPDDLPAAYIQCAMDAIGPGLEESGAIELGPQ